MSFITAYTDWATQRTSASVSYHRYGALCILGAALGNRVWIDMGWGKIYPSTWIAFVGRSNDRKSTAIHLICSLLAQADPKMEYPHDFTREAMYEFLAKQPAGLLKWREMGSVLESFSQKYNNGLLSTLVDLWDSPYMTKRVTKGGGPITINSPAISILGGAKERWFIENIHQRDVEGGFLGRWLFVTDDGTANRNHDMLFGNPWSAGDSQVRDGLIEHLQVLCNFEGGEIAPGDGAAVAEEWWKGWNAKGWNEDNDPADMGARAGTQVIKLAIALQAAEGTTHLYELEPDAVRRAAKFYEYAFHCGQPLVAKMVGRTRNSDLIEKLLKFVRSKSQVPVRDVYRKFNMPKREMEELLSGSIEAELIRLEDGCYRAN